VHGGHSEKPRYFRTGIEGELEEGYKGLGYVEEAPLPMLDVLELRHDVATGEETLVAGVDDPLYKVTTPVASLGFIESYPIQPRHTPDRRIEWNLTPLYRGVDSVHWQHRYSVKDGGATAGVCLGGLWGRAGSGFVPLYLDGGGWLISELCQHVRRQPSIAVKLRWAGAPLKWAGGRPRMWAARATGGRLKALANGVDRSRSENHRTFNEVLDEASVALLGYLRRSPAPGWSPLFSATHPVLADQYITRSEVEASDMGYRVEGVLGYAVDRFADRSPETHPTEIKWASHFGQRRRYIEGRRPWLYALEDSYNGAHHQSAAYRPR
jgi:hypothetical protein